MNKELINLVDVSKSFDGEMVLDELNLNIHENEFLTLLGPSGFWAALSPRTKGVLFLMARILPVYPPINGSSTPYSRNTPSFPI